MRDGIYNLLGSGIRRRTGSPTHTIPYIFFPIFELFLAGLCGQRRSPSSHLWSGMKSVIQYIVVLAVLSIALLIAVHGHLKASPSGSHDWYLGGALRGYSATAGTGTGGSKRNRRSWAKDRASWRDLLQLSTAAWIKSAEGEAEDPPKLVRDEAYRGEPFWRCVHEDQPSELMKSPWNGRTIATNWDANNTKLKSHNCIKVQDAALGEVNEKVRLCEGLVGGVK